MRATKPAREPASQRASTAAMLLADGSRSACSAWRSVRRSPASTGTTDSPCPRRRSVSAASAPVSAIVGPSSPGSQRMVAEHEIGGHHLRDARDRSRVLVRAGLDARLSYLDSCLTVRRPTVAGRASRSHRAGGPPNAVVGGRRSRTRRAPATGSRTRRASAAEAEQPGEEESEEGPGAMFWGLAMGMKAHMGGAVLPARMRFFDTPAISRRLLDMGGCGYWSSRTSLHGRGHP